MQISRGLRELLSDLRRRRDDDPATGEARVRHGSVRPHRRRLTPHGRGNSHAGGAGIFGNAVVGRVGLEPTTKGL